MPELSDLRVRIMSKPKPYGSGESSRPVALGLREATLADVRAVLEAEGAEVVDTGWHPMKTFGDGPGVFFPPGRYLVWRIEEVDTDGIS